MIHVRAQSPQVPAAAIVGEVLRRDGNELSRRGGPAGQGEHVDLAVGEQSLELALADTGNVGIEVVVAGNGEVTAEIRYVGYGIEPVVAAEVRLAVIGQDSPQQGFLLAARIAGRGLKAPQLTPERRGDELLGEEADELSKGALGPLRQQGDTHGCPLHRLGRAWRLE